MFVIYIYNVLIYSYIRNTHIFIFKKVVPATAVIHYLFYTHLLSAKKSFKNCEYYVNVRSLRNC